MNGRFILQNVALDEQELTLKLLEELPIVATPGLISPLDNQFFNPEPEKLGKITKEDLRNGIIYRVTQDNVPNERISTVEVYPVRTPIYKDIMKYDLTRLGSKWRITELWGTDGMLVLETRRKRRIYEFCLNGKDRI